MKKLLCLLMTTLLSVSPIYAQSLRDPGGRDGVPAPFEQLFSLEFHPAPDTQTWSSAVEPYEVWEDGQLIGRIYLDMHPREEKFRHNGAFRLRPGGGAVPEADRRYREMILEPTGTAPMADLIEQFLGHPFNADAWGRWLKGEEVVQATHKD